MGGSALQISVRIGEVQNFWYLLLTKTGVSSTWLHASSSFPKRRGKIVHALLKVPQPPQFFWRQVWLNRLTQVPKILIEISSTDRFNDSFVCLFCCFGSFGW
uniref:Uncharacterized protein n=1 Tax=Palpitomonas bilix TaxID=652834 RepID=A0A7S3D0Y0_9EUKA